ncbi:MAG: lipopolysaccharide assembly protein LapA domain-containing protein [Pseudohongiellaceae bacterium]
MTKLMQFLGSLFLLLVFLAVIAFSMLNTARVGLSLWLWDFAPQPVSVWIILAFVLGGSLGLLFGTGFSHYFKTRRELIQLRKRAHLAETEVARLRSLALKEIK